MISTADLPAQLIAKAETAWHSAQALLELGDVDGAANRAYYAMFDAARAALLVNAAPVEDDMSRTHSGLIGAFGKHLVKNGSVPKSMGRLLNRAHEIRLVADYHADCIETADATEMVAQARRFITAMHALCTGENPGSADQAIQVGAAPEKD